MLRRVVVLRVRCDVVCSVGTHKQNTRRSMRRNRTATLRERLVELCHHDDDDCLHLQTSNRRLLRASHRRSHHLHHRRLDHRVTANYHPHADDGVVVEDGDEWHVDKGMTVETSEL